MAMALPTCQNNISEVKISIISLIHNKLWTHHIICVNELFCQTVSNCHAWALWKLGISHLKLFELVNVYVPRNNVEKLHVPTKNVEKVYVPKKNIERVYVPTKNIEKVYVPTKNIEKV